MRQLRCVYQMAYVVADLEAAAKQWISLVQAGPFYVFRHFPFKNPTASGAPADVDISIALGLSGAIHVELIQVHRDPAGIFAAANAIKLPALHHIARLTDTVEADVAAMEAAGARCVFGASFEPDIRFRFMDTRATLGCYTEFVEFTPLVDGMLKVIEDATAAFDGKDPFRSF